MPHEHRIMQSLYATAIRRGARSDEQLIDTVCEVHQLEDAHCAATDAR